jgi:asparagine synthase (glutamine-hydrolysing)
MAALAESWDAWQAVSRDPLDALSGHYARWYLADGVLQKVDRASMGHSLEARAPLLDPDVVALARALPVRMKLRGRTTKWALRRLAMDKLPRDIVTRPKKGFGVPLAAWLRGPLKAWLTDLLQGTALRQSGWIDAAAVDRLLDQHLRGRVDHRKPLWALAGLASWQLRGRPKGPA